ncbi:COX15/CtaA family protein [Legionella septentrionalis]|uniref:COX15/CtaA family protein n=1 Tax=Legionella septentrionalis TaxID=2498109 RepID=UPI000F8D451F|nr:COX15/CtaA family protein [Legionella septentrionalis]RUR02370.1 heme A synthase [Legionella septentrionalis]
MSVKFLRRITTLALILALFVVMLGAFTRLTDAGLGCPDWPGCYGHLVLPTAQNKLTHMQTQYPGAFIETQKAWTEMIHRYAAGSLGLLTLCIFLGVHRYHRFLRSENPVFSQNAIQVSKKLPLILLGLLLFQALLGMWTVTLKLLPIVVMAHLLGGMLIFATLCYFRWQLSDFTPKYLPRWRFWIALGALLVFMQIALGGWVSSNYAGVACVGFPQCNGEWVPDLYFSQGFNLFSPVGANYQGGLLDNHVRVTIQFIHRVGAYVTASYVIILALCLLKKTQYSHLRAVALAALLLVLGQFLLGVFNVIYLLPLKVAVAHNGLAALLFAAMCSLLYLSRGNAIHAAN